MRPLSLMISLFLVLVLTFCSRNKLDVNTKGINVNVEIQRFDRELFGMDTDTLPAAIDYFYRKYYDFFEIFSYHIIAIGMPSEKTFPGYLGMFITDKQNREVFNETMKVFPDLKQEEKILSEAFKRFVHHFPGDTLPMVVSYISRFNNPFFSVGNYLGTGLDMYLGKESRYYKSLDLPQYIKLNMYREKIPSDLMYAWAQSLFPYHDSVSNLLSHIIYQGKLMYFTEAMLPDQADEVLVGFTRDQLEWVRKNERMMWIYLVENKLLFSTDQMNIRKLIGPAPFTYFFTRESPGRAGIWIGWQIIRDYARRNPGLSLKQIMMETDCQMILEGSKYNP